MISVDNALELILSQSLPKEAELVELKDALGKVMAQPVLADRDAPPFDRVTMDGIALQADALANNAGFTIENIQPAGAEKIRLTNRDGCIEVMTGAILPENTDCVIPYEKIEIKAGVAYPFSVDHPKGGNIHFKGTDAKKGFTLLREGIMVSPSVAGVLATVGMAKVKIQKAPKVAVCSTGDELVDIQEQPLPHQIRKSNAAMLEAALLDLGLQADVFHLADDKEAMTAQLAPMIKDYAVLLFSGAVSKGKYDFLPAVLEGLGMEKIIHGVAQRPGKPFLFGTFPETLVFGFPGNPASTLVCFHSYFKPWLRQHLGLLPTQHTAILDRDIVFDKPLTYHLLVSLTVENGNLTARPVDNSGSGDLVHLAQTDAILSLPPERERFQAGEVFPINLLRKELFYM